MDIKRQTRTGRYIHNRRGNVKRVDYENWLVDISWDQSGGGQAEAPLSAAFCSPRAILAGMPEVGTTVLSDFIENGPHSSKAAISTYIPTGKRAGINLRLQSSSRKDLSSIGVSATSYRRKFRKLYPGEIIGSSTQGSDMLLDENHLMTDMKGDEIRIDSRDQSINQISINNFRLTDAARKSEGWVYRYIEESYGEDGALLESPAADEYSKDLRNPDDTQPYVYDESSKKRWYRTVRGDTTVDNYFLSRDKEFLDLNSLPLVEVRSEVREIGAAHLPMSDHNVEKDIWSIENKDILIPEEFTEERPKRTKPFPLGNIIESVSGTLVGYDAYSPNYGKVLAPVIFTSEETAGFSVQEVPVDDGRDPDYTPVRYQAAAYMWKMPNTYSSTRMYVTKEGHINMHVGATFQIADCPFLPKWQHNLGGGRSVEANFAGSIKAVIDKNVRKEESIDLKTIGKVYFHFGKDDGIPSKTRRTTSVDGNEDYKGGVTKPILSAEEGKPATATYTSIQGVTDGGIVLRIGRNHGRNIREYEVNGFDATGRVMRKTGIIGDVRDSDRKTYGQGDALYQFDSQRKTLDHKLVEIGYGAPGRIGATEDDKRTNAGPITSPNNMATSLDAHLVGSAFLRVGKDSDELSLITDLDGGIAAWIGADKKDNRSITMNLDGGIEANIGKMDGSGNSIQAMLHGGIELRVRGNNKEQDFSIIAEGDQELKFIGNQNVTYEGSLDHTITVDSISTVGANHSLNISRMSRVNVTGSRSTLISNESPPIGEKAADQTIVKRGNMEFHIKELGDMLHKIKAGKIMIINELGDEEFKALIGKIVMEAMQGQILLQTPLTKVGPPTSIKFPVVTAATGCILTGGSLPHTMGSPHMKLADSLPPPPPALPVPPIPEI